MIFVTLVNTHQLSWVESGCQSVQSARFDSSQPVELSWVVGVARIFSGCAFFPQKVDYLFLLVALNPHAESAD